MRFVHVEHASRSQDAEQSWLSKTDPASALKELGSWEYMRMSCQLQNEDGSVIAINPTLEMGHIVQASQSNHIHAEIWRMIRNSQAGRRHLGCLYLLCCKMGAYLHCWIIIRNRDNESDTLRLQKSSNWYLRTGIKSKWPFRDSKHEWNKYHSRQWSSGMSWILSPSSWILEARSLALPPCALLFLYLLVYESESQDHWLSEARNSSLLFTGVSSILCSS